MRIDLRPLAKESQTNALSVSFDATEWLEKRRDVRAVSRINLNGQIRSIVGEVVIEGQVTFEVEALCSRCVKDITQLVQLPFMARFLQQDNQFIHISDDDFDKEILPNSEIDLVPYVKEVFYLGFPEVFIIRDEDDQHCKICRIDLNEQFDDGQPKQIDPRLAILQNFVVKQDN
jgi:uncharacterized protein